MSSQFSLEVNPQIQNTVSLLLTINTLRLFQQKGIVSKEEISSLIDVSISQISQNDDDLSKEAANVLNGLRGYFP